MLTEFIPLPSRLACSASSRALCSSSSTAITFDDDDDDDDAPIPTCSQSTAHATDIVTDDNAVAVCELSRSRTSYYNNWNCHSHRTISLVDRSAQRLGLLSAAQDEDGSESSSICSVSTMSSCSYEQLNSIPAIDTDDEPRDGQHRSTTRNDCQSLVSVTPDIDLDSLSTTSTDSYSASDVDDSLSDVCSVYDNDDAWTGARHRLVAAGRSELTVQRERNKDRSQVNGKDMRADNVDKDALASYRRLDGREVATITMLELELLASDLSRQMSSMHRTMRLLSCELATQMATLINRQTHDDCARKGHRCGELSEVIIDRFPYILIKICIFMNHRQKQ